MKELSPAAQAVLTAVTQQEYCLDPSDIPTEAARISYALAAALRAVVDQVAPSDAMEPRNNIPMAIECQRIRAELLAIADELEGMSN